jgi:hypothetical protein
MPHRIEPAPSGRASCRGCKKPIAKDTLRFAEETPNPYSEDGGTSFRYWHLSCAATKLANEVRDAMASYEGPIDDRSSLEAIVQQHVRPDLPYAERAPSGRARCRACDGAIQKGELRVAFERVFESPMGPQKAAAYAHPRCVQRYVEREAEHGRAGMDRDEALRQVLAHSKLAPEDAEIVSLEWVSGST